MKKVAVLSMSLILAACSSVPTYQERLEQQRQNRIATQTQTVNSAPEWFLNPPRTPGVIYATGTFASQNWDLANRTAVDLALGKICVKMGGTVKQQSRVFQREVNGNAQEFSETAIKSLCPNINVTGFELMARDTITDINGRIRVYILIAMSETGGKVNQTVLDSANQAFDRLDAEVESANQPQSSVDPVGTVASNGQLRLLDVDNEEYKKRRDACLQRPDCVIGQVTVR